LIPEESRFQTWFDPSDLIIGDTISKNQLTVSPWRINLRLFSYEYRVVPSITSNNRLAMSAGYSRFGADAKEL
jgi:hypothetical protein